MAKRAYTPEHIICHLRGAGLLLSHGPAVAQVSKKIDVSEQTYYRWCREYGDIGVKQMNIEETATNMRPKSQSVGVLQLLGWLTSLLPLRRPFAPPRPRTERLFGNSLT